MKKKIFLSALVTLAFCWGVEPSLNQSNWYNTLYPSAENIAEELINYARKGDQEKLFGTLDPILDKINISGALRGKTLLMEAAYGKHVGICEKLLELGADPRVTGSQTIRCDELLSDSPLTLLFVRAENFIQSKIKEARRNAAAGNKEAIERFLEYKWVSTYTTEEGPHQSPRVYDLLLMDALRNDHIELCKFMITVGANVNYVDREGKTPIVRAIEKESERLIYCEWLIENGADLTFVDKTGKTPLVWAVEQKDLELTKYLVDEINRQRSPEKYWEDYGFIQALCASLDNERTFFNLLLSNMESVESLERRFKSPLIAAIEHQDLEACRALIEKGADVNKSERYAIPPLNVAVSVGNKEIAQLLIDRGASVNARHGNRETSLMIAAGNNDLNCLNLLLDKGADLKMVFSCWSRNTYSPLTMAVESNSADTFNKIVEVIEEKKRQENVDIEEYYVSAAVSVCVRKEQTAFCRVLLEKFYTEPTMKENLKNAFFDAVTTNNIELLKLLKEYGAPIDDCNHKGKTPLCIAVEQRNKEIAKLLLGWNPTPKVHLISDSGERFSIESDVKALRDEMSCEIQPSQQRQQNETRSANQVPQKPYSKKGSRKCRCVIQ